MFTSFSDSDNTKGITRYNPWIIYEDIYTVTSWILIVNWVNWELIRWAVRHQTHASSRNQSHVSGRCHHLGRKVQTHFKVFLVVWTISRRKPIISFACCINRFVVFLGSELGPGCSQSVTWVSHVQAAAVRTVQSVLLYSLLQQISCNL